MLDPEALQRLRRVGGDPLILRMIELFFTHAASKLDLAVASFKAGQLDALERAVHSLKSSAANLGAVELREIASRIERFAGERNASATAPLVPALEEAFARAKSLLEEQRRELAP